MSKALIDRIADELRASVTIMELAKLTKLQRMAAGVEMTVTQDQDKWTVVLESKGRLHKECNKADLPGDTEADLARAVLMNTPGTLTATSCESCCKPPSTKDEDVSTVDLEELFKKQAMEQDPERSFKLTHGRWELYMEPLPKHGPIVQWYASLHVDGYFMDNVRHTTKLSAITELFKRVRESKGCAQDAPAGPGDDYDAQWRRLLEMIGGNADLLMNRPCSDRWCGWTARAFHIDTDEHSGECVELSYGESELSGYGFTMKEALDRLAGQLENGEGPWPPLAMLDIFEERMWNEAKQDKTSDNYEQDGWKMWLWLHKDAEGNAVYQAGLGHGKNTWWSERPCLTRVAAVHSLREKLESLRNDMVRKMSDKQQA